MAAPAGPQPAATPTPTAPPPPPPISSVGSLLSLARSLALLVALLAGVLFLVFLVLSLLNVLLGQPATSLVSAAYSLVAAVVNYLAWRAIPGLEKLAQDGHWGVLRERLLVWVVLGIVFYVIVGVVLLIAWIRVEETARPAPPPPPPGAPASGAPPNCPTCSNPTTWIREYNRFYCYRCSRYV